MSFQTYEGLIQKKEINEVKRKHSFDFTTKLTSKIKELKELLKINTEQLVGLREHGTKLDITIKELEISKIKNEIDGHLIDLELYKLNFIKQVK